MNYVRARGFVNVSEEKALPPDATTPSAWRLRGPRGLLVIMCVALLVFAFAFEGLAVESVDVRTYLEMTRGIASHGLPYMDNGQVDRFEAMRVPWNLPVRGHTWGVYGPVYPYFGALFLAAGGIRLLTSVTCALVVPIAILTFLLARKVLEDERYALVASLITALSTPILAKSLETTAYPLVVLFAVAATYTTVEAIGSRGRRRLIFSAATGLLASLCSGSHLLGLPMGAALIGILGLADTTEGGLERGPAWLARTPLRSLWPSAATLTSAAVAAFALAVGVLPVALLNRIRFGGYNPFTYGPTPWRGSDWNSVDQQSIGGHLRFAFPCLVLAVVIIALLALVELLPERRWLARLSIFAAAAVAIYVFPVLRTRLLRFAAAGFGLIVDQSVVDLSDSYHRAPGGFGYLYGPWVIKSTLQCSPIFALVFALPRLDARKRIQTLAILAPVAALYAYLILRANLSLSTALGFPWVYIRYTFPALPMLSVGATLVVREVAPTRGQWILAAIAGAALFAVLRLSSTNDAPLFRQVVVLVLPIVIVVGALACVLLWRRRIVGQRVAAIAVALTCAAGFAIGLGHDLRANLDGKAYLNDRIRTVARVMPQRFAVYGYLGPLDSVLSMRASRDVEYADLYQLDDGLKVRRVIDYWFSQKRPVFFAGENDRATSPWPDLTYELVDRGHNFYRVVPK